MRSHPKSNIPPLWESVSTPLDTYIILHFPVQFLKVRFDRCNSPDTLCQTSPWVRRRGAAGSDGPSSADERAPPRSSGHAPWRGWSSFTTSTISHYYFMDAGYLGVYVGSRASWPTEPTNCKLCSLLSNHFSKSTSARECNRHKPLFTK